MWGGLCFSCCLYAKGALGWGAAFGLFVCLLGLHSCCSLEKLSRQGGWKQAAVRLVTAFYGLCLCWALYLTVADVFCHPDPPPENTNVIVLGAQVYSAERMSISLTGRVEKPMSTFPETRKPSASSPEGQGSDEPCPEAVTQQNALIGMGIEEGRIFLEDRSHNTRENFKFAKEIADEQGMGRKWQWSPRGSICTVRSSWSKAAGFEPYSLVAETDPLLFPEYYGRELLSLTKWQVERLVLE